MREYHAKELRKEKKNCYEWQLNSKAISKMSGRREANYDLLRIIATVGVIILHIADDYIYNVEGEPWWWYAIGSSFISLACGAVPIFVMLSGTFLLTNEKNCDFKKFYKKSFFHLGIPTIIFSLLYFLYNLSKYYKNTLLGLDNQYLLKDFVTDWVRGEPFYHMWYMYMLIGLYLCVPFLVILKKSISPKAWRNLACFLLVWASIVQSNTTFKLVWPLEFVQYLGYIVIGVDL